MSSLPFPKIRATAIDGRLLNPFYRQEVLYRFHTSLSSKSTTIQNTITSSIGTTASEAAVEVFLTLSAIRSHYESLNAKQDIEEEYLVSHGKDNLKRREPVGIVYVDAGTGHTPFYSSVVAVSAAIAAGNCVILKLDNTIGALPKFLRDTLSQGLDSDVFGITSLAPSDSFFENTNTTKLFQKESSGPPSFSNLVSHSSTPAIAIVDRTADLRTAAEALVTSRFAFEGRSPYAPDLVLVNEFIKKDFVEEVLKIAFKYLSGSEVLADGDVRSTNRPKNVKQALEKLQKLGSTRTITSGDAGAAIELLSRTSLVPLSKNTAPILAIHTFTSLEDAIDFSNSATPSSNSLLAAYHFGNLVTCKYTSQFVKSDIGFINHIPFELLVGPAAPVGSPFSLHPRYVPQLFTVPSPQFVNPSKESQTLGAVIQGDKKGLNKMLEGAKKGLPVEKRPESIATGFFEQGILIGLGMIGVPVLAVVMSTVGFGVRWAWLKWR